MDEVAETRAAAYREHPLQAEVARLTAERDRAQTEMLFWLGESRRLRAWVDGYYRDTTTLLRACVVITTVFMLVGFALGRCSR